MPISGTGSSLRGHRLQQAGAGMEKRVFFEQPADALSSRRGTACDHAYLFHLAGGSGFLPVDDLARRFRPVDAVRRARQFSSVVQR